MKNILLLGIYFVFSNTFLFSQEKAKQLECFYVYSGAFVQEQHFFPTGIMGDGSDLKISGEYSFETPSKANKCLKLSYRPKGEKGWVAVYWQHPPNNWGDIDGGYDLRGAEYLSFWVKGKNGGERISEVKIGGITGQYPDSDTASVGPLKLSKKWKKYKIKLKNKDLRHISGGFCISFEKAMNRRGATIYLDEVKYEGKHIPGVRWTQDKEPPDVDLTLERNELTPGKLEGKTFLFRLKATDNIGIKTWSLTITDFVGKVVKHWEGNNTVPRTLSWDAKDENTLGYVFPGFYTCSLIARDKNSNIGKDRERLKVNPKSTHIKLKEGKRGLVVGLTSKVLFDFDKWDLKKSAYDTLDEVIELLNAYPENKISVEGHTDKVGPRAYNQELSEKRAQAVYNYLVQKGIDKNRLGIKGWGELKPIATNTTVTGRSLNRRVEIIILKQ